MRSLTAGVGVRTRQTSPAKSPARPGLTLGTTARLKTVALFPISTSKPPARARFLEPRMKHVPEGTVTSGLILHDPGCGYPEEDRGRVAWMAFNIPATA